MKSDGSEEPTAASDAAHILGTTASSLMQRSTQIKKSVDSALSLKKSREKGLKAASPIVKSKTKAGDGSKVLQTPASSSSASSVAVQIKDPGIVPIGHSCMADFLDGATAAQQAQVRMICHVFETMDADNDGQLSVADIRAYFRTIGRNSSDVIVRRWIGQRDVDQDGSVSLAEFIASYSQQLDPASCVRGNNGSVSVFPSAYILSPVTRAFGAICLGNTPAEVTEACIATEEYVRRVLDSPSVQSFWRIFVSDDAFDKRIGRLFGGSKLIQSMGFEPEQNGAVLALRDPTGRIWDILPADVRVMMNMRLQELKSHEQALMEPTVSNIAAGR